MGLGDLTRRDLTLSSSLNLETRQEENMAHLEAPQPPNAALPVYFDVDEHVGAQPAANKREDVLLVQFACKVMADSPPATITPNELNIVRAVRVTGSVDQATITAIRTFQEATKRITPSAVVDGRVSPTKGSRYFYGGVAWTIVQLNVQLRLRHVNIWPRIDKISGCPDELKQMVIRQVCGT
jgi:hypothetical protein